MSSRVVHPRTLAEGPPCSRSRPDGSDKEDHRHRRPYARRHRRRTSRPGHLYWTNRASRAATTARSSAATSTGHNRTTIVPEGATFTPKQLQLDKARRQAPTGAIAKGMRVDARQPRRLADRERWCRPARPPPIGGDATKVVRRPSPLDLEARPDLLDAERGPDQRRKGPHLPGAGPVEPSRARRGTAATRQRYRSAVRRPARADRSRDRPRKTGSLYWTDRGDGAARQNTVRAARPLDPGAQRPGPRRQIVFRDLMEGIGIALDSRRGRAHVHDRSRRLGPTSRASDGSKPSVLLFTQGQSFRPIGLRQPPIKGCMT